MKIRTALSLALNGRGLLTLRVRRLYRPFFRVCFLAAASRSGLLPMLAGGALPFDKIAERFAPEPTTHEGLRAWLQFGVQLKDLRRTLDGFGLGSRLARLLAEPSNDAAAAIVQEMAELDSMLILQSLKRLQDRKLMTVAEQDGELIARSSRLIEPFVSEAVDAMVPHLGPFRLLEVGCGSGCYIRRAAERNPQLAAVGLELQPDVAMLARENLARWGLSDRTRVEVRDLRDRTPEPTFDLVTLHNNIYYFPEQSRVAVLRHARAFLKPTGRILLTTACQTEDLALAFLNLWGAMTEGCGRAPNVIELIEQLAEAGFSRVRRKSLIPFVGYYSFTGTNPPVKS